MKACDCEHRDHFHSGDDDQEPPVKHYYGALAEIVVKVKTIFGIFEVCEACADSCYKEFPRV